ncbi:MAG: chaperone modulator CbpM [Pseudomonadota bacterium]|nr:chaperone modulator CbpM [Pseudomonadota bacterium]
MTDYLTATVVEDDAPLSLAELARACRAAEDQLHVWVVEGVLSPIGNSPDEWRFTGSSLRRARIALTLTRELEVNPPGVALALDLMERIDALEAHLRRR